ncbi:hypothetical protein BE04_26655 [Sorangium cellulosum]|uniref:Uncharacterized protein n=2 Tax=Sorangium cellulosum TaxID=56 RepID=A0A150Q8D2_SORCE|nr:hypothetical protein SCE1572_30565 [Sorangium cellulosum So0157-2]KYF64230.1 hypothetical protein BE04_26655 [Sorangium cellulosum]
MAGDEAPNESAIVTQVLVLAMGYCLVQSVEQIGVRTRPPRVAALWLVTHEGQKNLRDHWCTQRNELLIIGRELRIALASFNLMFNRDEGGVSSGRRKLNQDVQITPLGRRRYWGGVNVERSSQRAKQSASCRQ